MLFYFCHLQGLFELNYITTTKQKQYFCLILLSYDTNTLYKPRILQLEFVKITVLESDLLGNGGVWLKSLSNYMQSWHSDCSTVSRIVGLESEKEKC